MPGHVGCSSATQPRWLFPPRCPSPVRRQSALVSLHSRASWSQRPTTVCAARYPASLPCVQLQLTPHKELWQAAAAFETVVFMHEQRTQGSQDKFQGVCQADTEPQHQLFLFWFLRHHLHVVLDPLSQRALVKRICPSSPSPLSLHGALCSRMPLDSV